MEPTEGAAGAPDVIDAFTTFHFALIALLAVVVVIVLVIMIRLRARARAERQAAEEARADAPATVEPPTAPAPPPIADAPLADTPIPAAAPLDAAPAREAASEEAAPAPAAAEQADDLTRMKGVGPKLSAQLGSLGYTRFDQIAALSPAEAEELDARLGTFKGRLQRDRWIDQAGYLARDDREGFEALFGKL